MSNEIVSWQDRLEQEARALAVAERPPVGTIKMQGAMMMYQDAQLPGNRVDAVVIANIKERRYYPNKFNPDEVELPLCFAHVRDTEEWIPHEEAREQQAPTCADCPYSRYGSDPEPGRRGQACREVRKLALIAADSIELGVEKAEIALMNVSTTNIKGWSKYVQQLSSEVRRPPWALITTILAKPDNKSQYRLEYSVARLLDMDDDLMAALMKKREQAMEILLTPYTEPEEEEKAPEPTRKDGKARKY